MTAFQWQTILHGEMFTPKYDGMCINFFKFTYRVISVQQVGRPPNIIHLAKESCANKLLKYIDNIAQLP